MDEDDKTERFKILGFRPQKENAYNKLLPYAEKLDKESNRLFIDIKTNLVKSVLAREMRPGCMVWTSRLNKYMKIYGLKFSKEDHIALVKLFYELVTIPDLEPTRINKFGSTLHFLLKKKLLSPKELQLDWRPLYDLCIRVMEKSKTDIGMYRYFSSLEGAIESLIRVCRIYFPVEATQDILDEFRPKLCPYGSADIASGIEYLELFLPIIMWPEEKHLGSDLWVEELFHLWEVCHNASLWENHLTWLMARLASYNTGRINWEPYIPIMFVRFKRALHLPVSYRQRQSGKQYKIDGAAMATWIVCCLGGTSDTTFFHLEKFMQTLESYYHPANIGKWSPKIRELLKKLSFYFVQRIYCERFRKPNWELPTPENFKLTDADIERFVNIMKPCLEQAMFSRQGSQDVAHAMQYLAALRPDIIVPIVLDKLYASMDSLTEPHKLTSSMICIMSVARFMVQGARNNYPEGPTHVYPLLTSLLPGIDPNDIRKCLMTFNLVSHFSNLAPLVNSSEASKYYDDLTEEEHTICEASAGLEDFVLQFFDRICIWVESNSLDFVRLEQSDNDHKSKLETVSETALFSVITAVLYQCSPEIFTAALKKVHNFATNRILESKISGKLVAILCACFTKVNPKETMKLFLPDLCNFIEGLLADDEILKEEQLDDELLYFLLLLSEMVDGHSELINYIEPLNRILERTLHMASTQGSRLAAHMLNLIMTSLSFMHPVEYRSCNQPYSTHIKDFFFVREWAKPGDMKTLNISWYVPGKAEIDCVQELLNKYLIPELEVLDKYSKGEITLDRKELRQRLRIISAILGCQSVLPQWQEPALQLVESALDPWAFVLEIGSFLVVTMPDGCNVRKLIADTIHNVQKKVLELDEGDTKSIYNIVHIYDILLFNKFRGRDFESHWKNFHMLKKVLEDRLHQNKSHLRYTLIDRVMLQHEFRNESRTCSFSDTHKQILLDLFELSVSHYSEVRIASQNKLFATVATFPYSYRVLIPHIKEILQLDTTEYHEKFKGCLFVLLGTKNTAIATRHDWNLVKELWPLIIKSKPSEKPSIVNLMNALTEAVRHFPTISIKLEVPERCLTAAFEVAKNVPTVLLDDPQIFIDAGRKALEAGNANRVVAYTEAVDSLLNACLKGNLHWRYNSMALSFIKDMVHADVKYSPEVVKFFLNALINDSLEIRKIALRVFLFILLQNKPKYKKMSVDPYSFSKCKATKVSPGIRSDNQWLLYNSKTVPTDDKEWDKPRYLHRRDFGYYAWPKALEVYAPSFEQPQIAKRLDHLNNQEKEIIAFFNEKNVDILIKYLSMEEKKGKDQFSGFRYLVFKNVFKSFEDHFLHLFIPHLERLAKDNQEQSQRCAAEIIGGIIRGSKHWNFDKVRKLWEILIPILRTAFSNMSVETLGDWGICFAMALDSRDPNRHHWLLEFLMDNPLAEQTSFIGCCRVYILQSALNQQSWRNAELTSRLLDYLKGHLSHPFQNVREKISSCLTVIFSEDLGFSNGNAVNCPKVGDFFKHVMPKLNNLYENTVDTMRKFEQNKQIDVASDRLKLISLNSNEDKDAAVRLFKTVSKYVTGSVTRMNYAAVPEHYELLPLACVLQSNDTDDELTTVCSNFLAVIGHTLILEQYVPAALAAINKVSTCPFWSARAVIAEFIPVLVFHNFATIIAHKEWVSEIQNIVLLLLEDVQPEVRIKAGRILSGFLHCHFIPDPSALLSEFKQKSRTKLKNRDFNRNSHVNSQASNQSICIRHAGVLGMCAFVSCHPYDVPDYLSDIFLELGKHLNDPQPIPTTIRQTLGDFKRTHHDNWDVHKLKFTEEELSLLSDLTVPPSYYA